MQEIAAGRGHVAQLRRGAGENCAAKERITRRDLRVIGEIAVGYERTDAQAAVLSILDSVERQMRDVNEPRGPRHILFHEVDNVGAPGNELCRRIGGNLAHGVGHVARARIAEVVHCPMSPAR